VWLSERALRFSAKGIDRWIASRVRYGGRKKNVTTPSCDPFDPSRPRCFHRTAMPLDEPFSREFIASLVYKSRHAPTVELRPTNK